MSIPFIYPPKIKTIHNNTAAQVGFLTFCSILTPIVNHCINSDLIIPLHFEEVYPLFQGHP